jgi:isoquinoline 1-oxidoreductase beta subunit
VDRRNFLKLSLASSATLSFAVVVTGEHLELVSSASASTAQKIGAWVSIAPDGTVTILSAGAEMGQGSMTSLPLILAEEMDADWSKVKIEFAPADKEIYGYTFQNAKGMAIVGSRAVMLYFNDLRTAGAQVRKVLVANAAQKWNVDAATLKTEPGFVVDASGRRMSYGEIASFAKVPSPLPTVDKGELKPKSQFRLIGKDMPRHDVPLKVNGTAQYAMDVQLPGMVYATVRHAPVHGAAPDSWNEQQVAKMKGVIGTVKLPDGVAVIADSLPNAMAARRALQVKWNKGDAAGYDSEAALMKTYEQVHSDPAAKTQTLQAVGDAKAAFASAAKTYKADFRSDYGYHAQMEPLNAVARMNDAGTAIEVWEGTQDPASSRAAIARACGFSESQVTLHQCYLGGGFGRRSLGDYSAEAARIAREVKRPVKLVWTREEDMQYGMFRPQSFQCLQAAVDSSGKVTGWTHCVVGDGGVLLQTGIRPYYYEVPNKFIESRGTPHGIRLKHWRAVGHVFNVFAIESLVDQMAVDAKMDPIEFRLQRMSPTPRARAVFEKVREMSNWYAPRPEGRALGVSVSERSGSLGAGVAEVSLDRSTGKIKVHKTWVAVDGGLIVQPEMARHNVESAILYGLSSVLHERVTIKEGVVQQSNFHDYHLLRMSDTPEMEVAFVERDAPPSGLGEIGNPWIAAAVANAVFRLTGKRLNHMPFTPERVKATLNA